MIGWILAAALALPPGAPPAPLPIADAPPAAAALLAVPDELRARLRAEVVEGHADPHERLQRLARFVHAPEALGMRYRDDATRTVTEAYATREANCLAFTLLFVALAREAGLEAYPQAIEQALAWRVEDNTIYRANHINAGVRIGDRRYTIDVASDSILARHHPVAVPDARLLALYYDNLGAELLERGRTAPALAYLQAAIALDPGYATHWSNRGVIELRAGHAAGAQAAYDHALALDPQHPGALFNMASLLARNHDLRAATYRRRLARVEEADPFHHFVRALEYEKNGDASQAAAHFRRAIRLHPDEHRFHFGLARVLARRGDLRAAARALERAQALSQGATRDRYQAKLDRLRRDQAQDATISQ